MVKKVNLKEGDNIPEKDHVVRYCSLKHMQHGKISYSAFELREREEYASVNWLEYFNGKMNPAQRIESIRNAIGKNRTLTKSGKLVKIPVLKIKGLSQDLQVQYHPTEDLSHAGIHHIEKDPNHAHSLARLASSDSCEKFDGKVTSSRK